MSEKRHIAGADMRYTIPPAVEDIASVRTTETYNLHRTFVQKFMFCAKAYKRTMLPQANRASIG